jgi:NarL family two-component system response regulator LiaR
MTGVASTPTERCAGHGIRNIRDRARSIGAELSLSTTTGVGTTVLARWAPSTTRRRAVCSAGRLRDAEGPGGVMHRVLLVDDHAVMREGLAVLLAGFGSIEVVGAAAGGAEAVELYAALSPDVVLMDLSMPEVDGVEAIARIIDSDPTARIIALTAFLEEDLVARAVGAGAKGYLVKQVSGGELVDAINTVAAGGSILSPEALGHLAHRHGHRKLGHDLTPRELDVLRLLSTGLTNQQIADQLSLRHGTVRIVVSNILSKLQADNRTSAAHIARRAGLVPGQ